MPTLPWISDGRDTQFESTSGKKSKRTHFQLANIDSLKLVKFLRKSSQVIESLLEENTVEAGIVGSQVETTKIPFAQGQIHLAVPEFFSGKNVLKKVIISTTPYPMKSEAIIDI